MFLQEVLKTSSKRLEDVLKTPWRCFCKSYWRHLQISWRRLEDIWLRQIYSPWWRRLPDVLKMSSKDVLPSWDVFWRCITQLNIFVFWRCVTQLNIFVFWRFITQLKMSSEDVLPSWRCLLKMYYSVEYICFDQDVLKMSSEDEDKRRLQDIFTKMNVCWFVSKSKSKWCERLKLHVTK